jgi:hypothetical protein
VLRNANIASVLRLLAGSLFQTFGFFMDCLRIMGLSNNLTCVKCGSEEEISVHILFEFEALASLRHTHLRSFFLGPEDIRKLSVRAIWKFGKGTGLL